MCTIRYCIIFETESLQKHVVVLLIVYAFTHGRVHYLVHPVFALVIANTPV